LHLPLASASQPVAVRLKDTLASTRPAAQAADVTGVIRWLVTLEDHDAAHP
jgi:hypothetical protein